MVKVWQLQEAKARFSAFLEASLAEGPQIVSRRGVAAAVLVPMEEWHRMRERAGPELKELLLAPGPRTEALTPPRATHLHRAPLGLD